MRVETPLAGNGETELPLRNVSGYNVVVAGEIAIERPSGLFITDRRTRVHRNKRTVGPSHQFGV